MHYLMTCKNCSTYLGGHEISEEHSFLYCSQTCEKKRTEKLFEKYKIEKENDYKGKKAALAFEYEKRMNKNKPVDENTGKPVKINKTTGKPRKKRVEKGPRKCGKCGAHGHNARTCNRR